MTKSTTRDRYFSFSKILERRIQTALTSKLNLCMIKIQTRFLIQYVNRSINKIASQKSPKTNKFGKGTAFASTKTEEI